MSGQPNPRAQYLLQGAILFQGAIPAIFLIAAATGLFTASANREKQERAETVSRLYGGEASRLALARASRADAYRLKPLTRAEAPEGGPPSGYPVTAGPIRIPARLAAEIGEALTSTTTHGVEVPRGCFPTYGVRIRFHAGADVVDVLLCFECNMLLVFHNNEKSGGEAFDFIRPILVRASKAIFPDDNQIQELDENL